MRKVLFFSLISIAILIGCSKEDTINYPASENPVIAVTSDALYSLPDRNFVIKAKLTDDLGLASLKISIPELFLDKTINFSSETLVKEYQLEYKFLAPGFTKKEETYKVNVTLTDVSGNSVSKQLTLYLNGDFEAPELQSLKPSNGTSIFKDQDTKVTVSFNVSDVTGIDYVVVKINDLGIYDSITLNGVKSYDYSKVFSIPSELKEYELLLTTKDNFIEPNSKTTKIYFSVVEGLPVMYLADVAKGTNLTSDIFGVPMYYHEKNGDEFVFKYYADKDNKEIYLLGQESSFEPHCFGLNSSNQLENSNNASPIVLKTKGYYLIKVNPLANTYSVENYTPSTAPLDPKQVELVFAGSGAVGASWDPKNRTYTLRPSSYNPYLLSVDMDLDGETLEGTLTPAHNDGWWEEPFFRIGSNGIAPLNGGGNTKFQPSKGLYTLWLDTELERVKLVKK